MTEILDSDNQFYRGAKFEILFAEFMKNDLGWHNYHERANQKGKANSRGANVDVVGIRTDSRYALFERLTWALSVVTIACGVLTVLLMLGEIDFGDLDLPWLFASIGLVSFGGAIFCFFWGKQFCDKHAWVECKNLKGKATYAQVQKCLHEIQDYVASGDKEYKFIAKYFVSANGFIENAHKLAVDNGFECYAFEDGKFVRKFYWK